MKTKYTPFLIAIAVGLLLILALVVCASIVDASESHATWLPLVLDTGGELYEDPCPPAWQVGGGCLPPAVTPEYPPTPTWAPTITPEGPTATPFVICLPEPCDD